MKDINECSTDELIDNIRYMICEIASRMHRQGFDAGSKQERQICLKDIEEARKEGIRNGMEVMRIIARDIVMREDEMRSAFNDEPPTYILCQYSAAQIVDMIGGDNVYKRLRDR